MATRRDIRESFYDELAASVSDHTATVRQEYPNDASAFPAVLHADAYRTVPMNRGAAPTRVTHTEDGESAYTYSTIMEGQFTLNIVDDNEQRKEDVYEAVRSYFEGYTHPLRDASDIHEDAFRVEVDDSISNDFTDRSPPARGDTLSVSVQYERLYTEDVDPTTDVVHNVDDTTYTTN